MKIEVKTMDILIQDTNGRNYRVIPTEFEKDYIINFLKTNRYENRIKNKSR